MLSDSRGSALKSLFTQNLKFTVFLGGPPGQIQVKILSSFKLLTSLGTWKHQNLLCDTWSAL